MEAPGFNLNLMRAPAVSAMALMAVIRQNDLALLPSNASFYSIVSQSAIINAPNPEDGVNDLVVANLVIAESKTEQSGIGTNANLELEFRELAKKWRDETGGYALTYRRFAHPTYHSFLIFSENNKAKIVPLILRELNQNPDWWFEALEYLTGQDPTKKGDNFHDAVKAWLKWGKENKLLF